jgi:hypothetical protein
VRWKIYSNLKKFVSLKCRNVCDKADLLLILTRDDQHFIRDTLIIKREAIEYFYHYVAISVGPDVLNSNLYVADR